MARGDTRLGQPGRDRDGDGRCGARPHMHEPVSLAMRMAFARSKQGMRTIATWKYILWIGDGRENEARQRIDEHGSGLAAPSIERCCRVRSVFVCMSSVAARLYTRRLMSVLSRLFYNSA